MSLNDNIHWVCRHFNKLSVAELHALLALRCSVFIMEQNCPYLDPDHKDLYSYHMMGWTGNEMVACARIVQPGFSYPEVSIGRVATLLAIRGTGVGKILMTKTMESVKENFGNVPIRISAQSYLLKYYQEYGFVRTEKAEYDEDNIPHMEMIYKPSA